MAGRFTGAVVLIACCCVGCSVEAVQPAQIKPPEEPIGLQVLRLHPDLKSQRFSDLLNFEATSDLVFLSAVGDGLQIDGARSHTGRSSLKLPGGTGTTTIKLRSVLGSREFPDDWTLLGGYFLSDRAGRVTLTCQAGDAVVSRHTTVLSAGRWTPVMVDLVTPSRTPKASSDEVTLTIEVESAGSVWLDDLILIDNTRWLLGVNEGQDDLVLYHRGFNYFCTSPGLFTMRISAAEFDPVAWNVEEANPLRVRFTSTGAEKSLTIYPDGRSYRDGAFRALTEAVRGEPLWLQQIQSPAEIQVPQSMGRMNRNSPGDTNNDGFNELRGAYTVLASGPRIELVVLPRTVPVLKPVLEISGLPPGQALVTVEGSLVQKTARLGDGTLLVELPLRVDRAVTVNVRVQ